MNKANIEKLEKDLKKLFDDKVKLHHFDDPKLLENVLQKALKESGLDVSSIQHQSNAIIEHFLRLQDYYCVETDNEFLEIFEIKVKNKKFQMVLRKQYSIYSSRALTVDLIENSQLKKEIKKFEKMLDSLKSILV